MIQTDSHVTPRRAVRPIAAGLVAAALASTAQALIIQPTTEAESKDTKIYQSVPTGNFSSNLSVVAPNVTNFSSLVQFDLSTLTLTAAQITSATFTLYCFGTGANGFFGGDVAVRSMLDAWKENAADAGTTPLATYDAFYGTTPTLHSGAIVATQTVPTGYVGFVSWDITSTVKAWKDGSLANNGLFFSVVTNDGDISFADVDSNGAAFAPSLTVVPEPGSIALLALGCLGFASRRRRERAG